LTATMAPRLTIALGRSSLLMLPFMSAVEADHHESISGTCAGVKEMYRSQSCCGNPEQEVDFVITPKPTKQLFGDRGIQANPGDGTNNNPCFDRKPLSSGLGAEPDEYFANQDCYDDAQVRLIEVLEQAGADVTEGYVGEIDASGRDPITDPYWKAGLCPVNVHWHLGAEHRSAGEYQETDDSFTESGPEAEHRRLSGDDSVRLGFRCSHYDANNEIFTTPYNWQHCVGLVVGETYEVHWPHSAAGACGTPWQYQTPFYDGVFCTGGIISLDPLNTFEKIGVQAQIFTIVNDESKYYPDLMRGMIMDGQMGADIGKYTGSTTGTSRNNEVCSKFTPITWQVDRKCHMISASSFDKMCADMKAQQDDMSGDLHAHGARELVDQALAANNLQRRV